MVIQAQTYLDLGWSVIPLRPREKTPLLNWQPFQQRLATPEEIQTWWAQPANIGIVTGAISNLIVQDIDSHAGLAYAHERGGIPHTPVSRTAKGIHVFYRHTETVPNRVRIVDGIDIRGDGGYVVAPHSLHPSGVTYQWVNPPDTPLANPPDWLLELITDPVQEWIANTLNGEVYTLPEQADYGERALASECSRLSSIPVGQRNNALNRAAYRMARLVPPRYLTEQQIEQTLIQVGHAIGLTETETWRTIRSGLNAGLSNPRR